MGRTLWSTVLKSLHVKALIVSKVLIVYKVNQELERGETEKTVKINKTTKLEGPPDYPT